MVRVIRLVDYQKLGCEVAWEDFKSSAQSIIAGIMVMAVTASESLKRC